ncbi:DUF6502 family protein [Tateyamaria omphalii]|uniref:Uncharacterized protein n=1 Tax=Tateyamaria omphalii TaxID=299262 RepID=A0A1P8MQF9_9RHOB|nr:DUF6502 family protein [Tateyamaria omphalii]APX10298.1 hypothetical protein BWR18_00220 [Tateyamaria omphalii]
MARREQTSASDAFMRVLRGLLRPLVRTMIARGLTAPVVYGLLKRVYVEVAEESFRLDDKPLTDSRIALLTGVHRKDIRTIKAEGPDETGQSRRKSALLATVIGQWMSAPEFITDGTPRLLPRQADDAADFETLVRSVNRDVRPRTVLDELMNAGLVSETADGLLELQTEAVVGTGSARDKEAFFAANVGDHLAAATENLLADTPPFFERAVFYNQLPPDAIDEVEAAARAKAQELLEDLNRQSSALHRAAQDAEGPRQRYRLGIYLYREDAAAADTDEKAPDP